MKNETFALTNENIESKVSMLRSLGESYRADTKMLTSVCLSLEEVLINFRDHFGTEQTIQMKLRKRSGELIINLVLIGKSFDPVGSDAIGEESYIIYTLGMMPRYTYSSGVNRVSLCLKLNRGKSELLTVIISVLLGVLLGALGRFLPGKLLENLMTVAGAVTDVIFGLIRMAALPVIFLCVVCGIIGSGTIRNFKENGLGFLRRTAAALFLFQLTSSVLFLLVNGIKFSHSTAQISLLQSVTDSLKSIFPDNIYTPFTGGDNLKVIMLGVIFGSALLAMEEKAGLVNQLAGQMKEACSLVMAWVGKHIPLLITVMLANNIWSGNLGAHVLKLWKIIAVYFVSALALQLVLTARVCRKRKMTIAQVTSAVIVPGLKAVATASTMLCYYDMVETLTKKLNVSENKINLSLPMGFAFYQPAGGMLAPIVLYFAAAAGTNIDLTWMLSFMLVTYVTSLAAPPVTGGMVAPLALLFTTLGVADPVVAMAYPLIMLLDYPGTGIRVMTMMLMVADEDERKIRR